MSDPERQRNIMLRFEAIERRLERLECVTTPASSPTRRRWPLVDVDPGCEVFAVKDPNGEVRCIGGIVCLGIEADGVQEAIIASPTTFLRISDTAGWTCETED